MKSILDLQFYSKDEYKTERDKIQSKYTQYFKTILHTKQIGGKKTPKAPINHTG